ncbi:MAG: DNA-binding protein [Candidatus Thorarchaeota archaeon]|nr:MAG: DNA-binding protein [Candidatus Thorarchaeota archaeon]RLI58910.1 MAG: DNA-binding protein [Candidatus Thorarchaeota archaeon]
MSDEELEAIRQRKLASLREQALQEQAQEQAAAEAQAQKEAVLRRILTPEARARLSNIRMVKPQFAEQIELQLIQLAGSGRLRSQVSDEQLKALLKQLQGQERERKITFR